MPEVVSPGEPEAQTLDGQQNADSEQDAIRKLKAKLIPKLKIGLLFTLIIYLAMFIVGVQSVKKCPVNENIPLFLCITGFVGLGSKLVTYLRDRIIPYFQIKYVESALYTTETVFFLLGSYWVYKEFKPSFNEYDKSTYCQKTAYMFAFIYLTLFYALILAIIVAALCICLCACLGISIINKLVERDIEAYESKKIQNNEEEVTEQSTNQK